MEVRSIPCAILIPNISEIHQAILEYFNLFGQYKLYKPIHMFKILYCDVTIQPTMVAMDMTFT